MRFYQGTIFAAVLSLAAVSAAQNYHVAEHWKIGGQGGWDYLLSDDGAHRLYIAHNSRVEVVDSATGRPLGAITGLKSTHGIALNPTGRSVTSPTERAMQSSFSTARISPSRRRLRPAPIPMALHSSRPQKPFGRLTGAAAMSLCWTLLLTPWLPPYRFPESRNFRRSTNTDRYS